MKKKLLFLILILAAACVTTVQLRRPQYENPALNGAKP